MPALRYSEDADLMSSSSALSCALPERVAPRAVAKQLPMLYPQLRRLARARLAGGSRFTLLDTTALVHESFMRLQAAEGFEPRDQEHYLAYAATTMRSVVIDYVRRRQAERHGGGAPHTGLTGANAEQVASDEEILEVHEALEALAGVDARLVQVVEMRYFGGLTDEEIATALGISDRTVRRDWERARLLLAVALGR
jgi:RNA polymerase sigma factor (TIGR02999 family)